jgi:hypothetical protein
MDARKEQREQRARVALELGRLIRRQARRRWSTVRTAERNAGGHHVWRFRFGPEASERFLHVTHAAMDQPADASRLLFQQLRTSRWLDRLVEGPETALCLSESGHLEPWPVQ